MVFLNSGMKYEIWHLCLRQTVPNKAFLSIKAGSSKNDAYISRQVVLNRAFIRLQAAPNMAFPSFNKDVQVTFLSVGRKYQPKRSYL